MAISSLSAPFCPGYRDKSELGESGSRAESTAQPDTFFFYLIFLSLLSRKRPRMLTARTYGRQRLGTVREGAICSFRSEECLALGPQWERYMG